MCGYIGRTIDSPGIQALFKVLGLDELVTQFTSVEPGTIEQFYPAFGKDPSRQIRGLIVEEEGELKLIDATWRYDCQKLGDSLAVGKLTTFNARNLNNRYWIEPLNYRRAILIATEIGESKLVGKTKHQYLMQLEPFFLGALYKKFSNGLYSCAVITRDPNPKTESYHEKSTPLFLPLDKNFIRLWLDKNIQQHPEIDNLLAHPKLFPELTVSRVKSFKSGKRMGEPTILDADAV